jgi:hypothetical protein
MRKLFTLFMVAAFALASSSLSAQTRLTKLSKSDVEPAGTVVKLNPAAPGICGSCAIPEGEGVIGLNYSGSINGGCTWDGLSTEINLGNVICGRTNSYPRTGTTNAREQDWYHLVLTQPATIYWAMDYNYAVGMEFWCISDCELLTVVDAWQFSGGPASLPPLNLAAGEYWFMVRTAAVLLPVGTEVEYSIKIDTTDPGENPSTWCPGPAAIPTLSQWGLIILGFVMLAFGTMYILRWKGTSA